MKKVKITVMRKVRHDDLIEEYEKELRYKEKINSSEYKKRRADRNAR